jgi:hypothetical protein
MFHKLKLFFSTKRGRKKELTFQNQTAAFLTSTVLVRAYYYLLLFFAVLLLPSWNEFTGYQAIAPLWPIFWIKYFDLKISAYFTLMFYLFGALTGAFFPEKRWARLLAFIGIFQFTSFTNSFGKIGHSNHTWILTSFILIFLPDLWQIKSPSRQIKQRFLIVFAACQGVILLTYTMSGLGKVLGLFYQIFIGQTSALSPNALPLIIADRLLETHSTSLLGPWLIQHSLIAWPGMILVIYLQFFSFCVLFRPIIHKVWAMALIVFHLGCFFALTIDFPQNILILSLFFLHSPFNQTRPSSRQVFAQLPLIGDIFFRTE